jgi:hypothetical protein
MKLKLVSIPAILTLVIAFLFSPLAVFADVPCTWVFCEDPLHPHYPAPAPVPPPQPVGPHGGMFSMDECFWCHTHLPTGPQFGRLKKRKVVESAFLQRPSWN